VDAAELQKRGAAWTKPALEFPRGWLARYTRVVTSAARGAILE
jgi:dihydroxy-acid dehydratase